MFKKNEVFLLLFFAVKVVQKTEQASLALFCFFGQEESVFMLQQYGVTYFYTSGPVLGFHPWFGAHLLLSCQRRYAWTRGVYGVGGLRLIAIAHRSAPRSNNS